MRTNARTHRARACTSARVSSRTPSPLATKTWSMCRWCPTAPATRRGEVPARAADAAAVPAADAGLVLATPAPALGIAPPPARSVPTLAGIPPPQLRVVLAVLRDRVRDHLRVRGSLPTVPRRPGVAAGPDPAVLAIESSVRVIGVEAVEDVHELRRPLRALLVEVPLALTRRGGVGGVRGRSPAAAAALSSRANGRLG